MPLDICYSTIASIHGLFVAKHSVACSSQIHLPEFAVRIAATAMLLAGALGTLRMLHSVPCGLQMP